MLKPRAVGIDDNRRQQNAQIFNIYNLYRLVLSLILLISYLFTADLNFLGSVDPELYFRASIFYIFFNLVVVSRGFLPKLKKVENFQYLAVTIIDIILLVTISYTCGGVSTGMTHLIIVPISAGSILFQNRIGTFLAAVGTLAAFYSEFYLNFTQERVDDFYVQAGLLGLTLFVISLILQYLGGKILQNEILAMRQAEDLQSLEEMNYQVIQRMRSGIIVVNAEGGILNSNNSAVKLLTQGGANENFLELPEQLAKELRLWQADNNYISGPITFHDSPTEIQASFSYLQPEKKIQRTDFSGRLFETQQPCPTVKTHISGQIDCQYCA
jgi:two-component system sensor histidine kinase PilS (NtrC family)